MSFRDNGDKEKVQSATDLVRLIGEHVTLRPKGREFAGLCPFHDDKTPSMQVSPQKQIYKCFSCGAGGDAFSFVMNYHKMTFVESLKYLAERAGVELTPWKPEGGRGGDADRGPSERKRIAAANESAVGFYRALLRHPEHGREARAYLDRRGVSAEMIEKFGLGYAPDRWDGLVTMIRDKGWDKLGFDKASLIRPRKTGDGDFDFLRHRLVFPIFDAIGRPIAFGGRKLREEDEPKYLNSPETTLFNKSATLYGLHVAKKPIIDAKTAVIVEGYTDVIACHQAGADNVVAALGTALTPEHVRELRRYCDQVVLVMDGDAAGQKAADRAIHVFLTGDLDVAIAVLPPGKDPDELLKAGGLDAWQDVIARAQDALAFAFDRVRARLEDAPTVTGRQHAVEDFMDQLIQLGLTDTGGVRRSFVIAQLAELLRLSEDAVQDLLKERSDRSSRNRYSSPRPAPATADTPGPDYEAGYIEAVLAQQDTDGQDDFAHHPDPGSASAHEAHTAADGPAAGQDHPAEEVAIAHSRHRLAAAGLAERRLIASLVRHPALFTATLADGSSLDEAISPAELAHPAHRRLYQRVYDALAEGQSLSLTGLSSDLTEEGLDPLRQLLLVADEELDRALPPAPEPDHPEETPTASETPGDTFPLIENLLRDAAAAVIRHHRETRYEMTRRAIQQAPADPAAAADQAAGLSQAELLRQLVEHRRSQADPRRIARLAR